MGKFRIDGLDESIRELERLGRFGEIAPKAVDAAAPILEKTVKAAVANAADRGYAEGDLEKSIRKTKAKMNQYGAFAVVKPNGKDRKGISNADKLMRLEYGRSGQAPHPCLAKAVSDAEEDCIKAMEEVIEKELGAE